MINTFIFVCVFPIVCNVQHLIVVVSSPHSGCSSNKLYAELKLSVLWLIAITKRWGRFEQFCSVV